MKMINNKIKNIGLATLLAASVISCKTNLDINVDPNFPTLATAQASLNCPLPCKTQPIFITGQLQATTTLLLHQSGLGTVVLVVTSLFLRKH